MADKTGKVIISEMDSTDGLYEVTFEGTAQDYGFDNETDFLEPEDAHEIAQEVADETNSEIVWEGYKPAWA